MNTPLQWEFWIDVGGTFTDCLAKTPEGKITTFKLLSSATFKGNASKENNTITTDMPNTPNGFFKKFELACFDVDRNLIANKILISDSKASELTGEFANIPDGQIFFELSSKENSPVVGIRWLMNLGSDSPIGPITVKLGTTKGTNALLEHQGAATGLVTTKGFRDVLTIGYQNRPHLFDLSIGRPEPLYSNTIEIDERITATGEVIKSLDISGIKQQLTKLMDEGINSLAICFMNSYINSAHENMVKEIAQGVGFDQISCSADLLPIQRIVPRGDTAVVDAYLTPVIKKYINSIKHSIPEADIQMMTSAGGLVDAKSFVGKDSILSGPAGGVVGVSEVCRSAGIDKAIGFDMGGTSTDVCKYDGEFERRFNMEFKSVGKDGKNLGVKIASPMLSIETVAAGGGSICWFDGIQLKVGPQSAGASPGPACYGSGGPLAVTDCNLFLGRIDSDRFAFPLDSSSVTNQLSKISDSMKRTLGTEQSLTEIAEGFLKIAAQNMGAPIKKISMTKGYDLREYTIVSFGGAGAQHACEVAESLGIDKIIQHPYASILSAYGIGAADLRFFASAPFQNKILDQDKLNPEIDDIYDTLKDELTVKFGSETDRTSYIRTLDLRYAGQDSLITVKTDSKSDILKTKKEFERLHQKLYGFIFENRQVEVRALHLERVDKLSKSDTSTLEEIKHSPPPIKKQSLIWNGTKHEANCFRFEDLKHGAEIAGPSLVFTRDTAIVVAPNWNAALRGNGNIEISTVDSQSQQIQIATECDPINLSLFNGRFTSIAEQMGATLQRTSLSVNVKERLDFSCAIFTENGDLVVNAPHIPVHLGAMGDTVKAIMRDLAPIKSGDVFISNDPYNGGSHLPDITVVCPVFSNDDELIFFTANRAHHSEIGGISPGSMPPHSTTLAEEGVLIRSFRLVENNKQSENKLIQILENAKFPTRSVKNNLADIRAQIASNEIGRQLLGELCERYGLETSKAYMKHMRDSAASKMKLALLGVAEGDYEFSDQMDNGIPICVKITVTHAEDGGRAKVDFSKTGPVDSGNLNANLAIVKAAVLYCFRCLINEDIPLNDGVLAPIEIITKSNSILSPPSAESPEQMPAVVGGNVETSTRIVDVILGALSLASASQGTMNNFLFGRPSSAGKEGFGYYETICGGSGAGPGFNGTNAVHTHMTNTRITDPEVLEERFPVRLNQFGVRKGSGGTGKYQGGDGAVREFEFLEPLTVSLMTQRRKTSPFGLEGGGEGASGHNLLCKAGEKEFKELPEMAQIEVRSGDRIRIETPGGGGYGNK
jgi:5-oxoprolinase (ATP-hydrolysing)